MDDLLDNFATQSLDSPPEEDGYKYHFVEDSPAASEHAMPLRPETSATLGPDGSIFDSEASGVHKVTASEDEDEGHYNADVDEDDHESDDGQDVWDGFAQHLQRLHRQDMERDELLTQLHQENVDLKRALKKSTPGGNPRAEAAERSLFEIRKTMERNPYAYVLIDGTGYKIHEDLLQFGKRGGAEAADRLWTEVSTYLQQQFGDAKEWKIMVHLYVDVEGLLTNDIRLKDGEVRDFMLGFTQAQPLFMIVDVGHDPEKLSRKVEEMFHLFANNVQCKHVIFGCCHNVAYAVALEPYVSNPIAASRITLLKSYENKPYFEGLPFNSVEFPHVFRSKPYKGTDLFAGDDDYMPDSSKQSDSSERDEALARWQAAANASIPLPARVRPQTEIQSGWTADYENILLNINDERVDHELEEVDYETSESMLDRMETQRFCVFYHLQNHCLTTAALGKPCNFRHGPRLNKDELRFLRQDFRRLRCDFGSQCRKPDCLYGHVCSSLKPGCEKDSTCVFFRLHEVDKTAVKVWSSSPENKRSSPRKNRS